MQKLTNPEIDAIESDLGFQLPGLYRKLLIEIGHGECDGFEIYHPREISGLYEHHFDNPADLFRSYFPFGCNNRMQEICLIDPSREVAASIWHETHPDDYPDERWLPYEQWMLEHDSKLPRAEI
ncbi:SMI1/KNR4 family protein [Massilia sp. CF038]|uniref:SMI1/KNR4 family protein n=1 Tax=Massilia sp. CF038 TaxID=1881045 RepID=UPI000915BB83|nr:SMI1/KNR4 family protein [Massilia sp. CF038]SHH10593.1 hypothetical protein SAMN05428948_2799 [Massilia sp. CF038]